MSRPGFMPPTRGRTFHGVTTAALMRRGVACAHALPAAHRLSRMSTARRNARRIVRAVGRADLGPHERNSSQPARPGLPQVRLSSLPAGAVRARAYRAARGTAPLSRRTVPPSSLSVRADASHSPLHALQSRTKHRRRLGLEDYGKTDGKHASRQVRAARARRCAERTAVAAVSCPRPSCGLLVARGVAWRGWMRACR